MLNLSDSGWSQSRTHTRYSMDCILVYITNEGNECIYRQIRGKQTICGCRAGAGSAPEITDKIAGMYGSTFGLELSLSSLKIPRSSAIPD